MCGAQFHSTAESAGETLVFARRLRGLTSSWWLVALGRHQDRRLGRWPPTTPSRDTHNCVSESNKSRPGRPTSFYGRHEATLCSRKLLGNYLGIGQRNHATSGYSGKQKKANLELRCTWDFGMESFATALPSKMDQADLATKLKI